MDGSVAGVLFKNKRINSQKVLLVVVDDHCGQKPGLKSWCLEPSCLGICSVGMGADPQLDFPAFHGSSLSDHSYPVCFLRSDKIAA